MGKVTQKEMVEDYLNKYGSISSLEAYLDLGIMRLAARIKELSDDGMKIKKEMETSKNRFGKNVSYARYKKAV